MLVNTQGPITFFDHPIYLPAVLPDASQAQPSHDLYFPIAPSPRGVDAVTSIFFSLRRDLAWLLLLEFLRSCRYIDDLFELHCLFLRELRYTTSSLWGFSGVYPPSLHLSTKVGPTANFLDLSIRPAHAVLHFYQHFVKLF